jgi:hypothetical protein
MIGTREIERRTGKSRCQAVAFKWLWHFRVCENDAIGKAPISEKGEKAINVQLETLRVFVVADGYVVEVHGQEFPRYLPLTGRV